MSDVSTRARARRGSMPLALGALVAAVFTLCASSAAAPAGTTILVTVGTPKEVSVKLSKSSGLTAGPVVFQVTNRGKAPHTFVVCSSPVSGLANNCTGRSVTLAKTGQTARLTVTFKKGKYEFLSIVSGQSVAGTKGALGVGLSVPIALSAIPSAKASGSGGKTTGSGGPTGSTGSTGAGTGGGTAGGLPVFPTGNPKNGLAVFDAAGCDSCHTLVAAGANGGGGPDLDDVMPSLTDVENQVYNGGGGMPPFGGTLTNQQIADVAAYVSSVA